MSSEGTNKYVQARLSTGFIYVIEKHVINENLRLNFLFADLRKW